MQRLLQSWVEKISESLGYQLIPKWRLKRLPLTQHLQKIFRHQAIDMVIDVGANAGQYRDFLRREVGFQGEIHSFEPLPHLAQRMRERQASDRAWHVHPFALGAQNGSCEINVMASDTFSSLRGVASDVPAQFAQSAQAVRTQSIEIRRLDALRERLSMSNRRAYLKIDTQGFDLEVLKGAKQTLSSVHALQIELAFQHIYQGVPDFREVLTLLEQWGYVVSAMFPISLDSNLVAVELDCALARKQPSAPAVPAKH